jgi:hypothetical protein
LRLGLWIPWLIFAVAVFAYGVYWTMLAQEGLRRLNATEGLSFTAATAGGAPFRAAFSLTDPVYTDAGGWTLTADTMTVHVNPANPRHVIGSLSSPVRLEGGDGRVFEAAGAALLFSVRGLDGPRPQVIAEATGLSVRTAEVRGPALSAKRLVIAARPDPRDPAGRQITFEAEGLSFAPAPYGLDALGPQAALLRAALSVPGGPAGTEPLRALAAGSSEARLEAFEVQWGPASATGTGVLRFAGFTPIGQLSLDFADPAGLSALAASPRLAPGDRTALEALARGRGLGVPLVLSGDGATLGGSRFTAVQDEAGSAYRAQ